jgi:major membrane immunogen (membrane-anchored lipoprotein)
MKITLFSIVALIALITIFSCKKSNNNSTPPTVTSSQWTYNNITYKGDTTFFIDDGGGNYILQSYINDTASHTAAVYFGTKPTKSGTFTVVDDNTNPTATQCSIYYGTLSEEYESTGGGTVTITIANGKITAVFSNIASENGSVSSKISGTLIATDN